MMTNLANQFLNGATIKYRCLGYEGGFVIAKFDRDLEIWLHRHETETEWRREPTSTYKARSIFPTDAELVEA